MIIVVLVRPETPENIGFIARAMGNFDLERMLLIDPLCDHKSLDASKTSKHAKHILENAKIRKYDYLKSMKKDFDVIVGTTAVIGSDYNIPRSPVSPEKFADMIKDENIALVFGNEGTGLTNEEIALCDFTVSIETSKKYPTLNISHAAAILFHELYKKKGKNKITGDHAPATYKEKKVIKERLENILESLDFSTEEKKQTQKITWARIFEKSMMSKRESFAVIGLLKKILDKFSKN